MNKSPLVLALTGMLGVAAAASKGAATPVCDAYVANISSSDVSVIDTSTNTVTATILVGSTPDGVAVSPDGAAVYVANAGSNSVSVIDTATNGVVTAIPVGQNPIGVAFTPDGAAAWVANYATPGSVSVINTATLSVVGSVPLAAGPDRVALRPDGQVAYTSQQVFNPGFVSVIDVATQAVVTTVTVGANPRGLAITPDGTALYVANNNSNNVSVIATTSNAVVATISGGPNPNDVAVTPDGAFAWVVNTNFYSGSGGSISVIDTSTNTVAQTIAMPAGSHPGGIAFTPDGATAYVGTGACCGGPNTVTVIDTTTRSALTTIPVGVNPVAIAIACHAAPSATATPTETPTDTPTATPTVTPTFAPFGVSGRVVYYSNAAPVQNATMLLQGNVPASIETNSTGGYAFGGIGGQDWDLQPEKVGDLGGAITALDAAYVLQAVVGLRTLTTEQRLAGDVTGNGTLTALDASLILQYRVGLIARFPVADHCVSDWAFVPVPELAPNQQTMPPQMRTDACQAGMISFTPLVVQSDGQDFLGVLFGDATGSWSPSQ